MSREASLDGNVNNQNSAVFNMSDESVVNGTITNSGTVTVSADAYLHELTVKPKGSFEIAGGIVDVITVEEANENTNKISGGTVYTLDNGEDSKIDISGGGIGDVTNAGILTVQGGAFGAYLKEGSYTYGKIKNESTGEITFQSGFDDQVGLITNSGIITIENSAVLNIETGNGDRAFTNENGAELTLNGVIKNTQAGKGTGISNESGATITDTSSGEINGFCFGMRNTEGSLPNGLVFNNNLYNFLDVLIVIGAEASSKDPDKYFSSVEAALKYINEHEQNFYGISIDLELAEYDKWSDYLTVSDNYSLDNLHDITSETRFQ